MASLRRWSNVLLLSVFLIISISMLEIEPVQGENGDNWRYHTSYEMADNLSSLAENHSDIAEYTTAQDLLGTRSIIGDRVIPILFIGNRSDESRKWIMLIGAHHGDEPDSAETVLGFAHYLLPAISRNVHSEKLIDGINIAMLPVVNPYGLDTGSRYDENNEDPNRDYPFSPEGYSLHSDGIPLTTAGAHAVHSLAKMYPFSIALSFHTGSKGIYTPWGAEGVESLTPDQEMFSDLGSVLSKASGVGMIHGPANDFGSLGYLRGAFDDHLYGSTFYSQFLSSSEMMLPWSTATATIEMDIGKGQDEDRLGDLTGIFYPGSANDGTVPMGIRISLAACYLLVPDMEGYVKEENGDGKLRLSLRGIASLNITSLTVAADGGKEDLEVSMDQHSFLPEYYLQADFDLFNASYNNVEMVVHFDQDWDVFRNDSDPAIAPQCLLSLSRSGSEGFMDLEWTIENSIPEVFPEVQILDVQPKLQEAGRNATITIDIPEGLGIPVSMYIHTRVDWNIETTWIPVENITTGTSTYEFFTPLLEGEADVQVNLTTDNGNFRTNSTMTLYPYVHLMTVTRSSENNNKFTVMVGVDGSLGPASVFYGVSRSLDIDWGEDGWVIPPVGEVAPSYGPYLFGIDLSSIGGDVYLRVCNFPGGVETVQDFHLSMRTGVTQPTVWVDNDRLVVGPSIMKYDWDGSVEINPSDYTITYTVYLIGPDNETLQVLNLTWMTKDQLSEKERSELKRVIAEEGVEEEMISGCWMGWLELPEDEGNYSLRIKIEGEMKVGSEAHLTGFLVDLTYHDPFSIEDKGQDEEGDDFPTGIVIFLIAAIAVIFIISLLRKKAQDQPEPRKAPEAVQQEENKEE